MGKKYDKRDLEIILDGCPSMAWIKDDEDRLVYVNESYLNTFQETRENIIGKKEEEVCGTPLIDGQLMIRGEVHYFEVNEQPICENNRVVGKMGVANNVTKEEKLQKVVESLMIEKLKEVPSQIQQDNKIVMDKLLGIWEQYLFVSMPPIGKMIVLYNQQIDQADIGLQQGACENWQGEDQKETLLNYVINRVGCHQHYGERIETALLGDGPYKILLEKADIKVVLEYPIYFGVEVEGMIYMHFNNDEMLQIQKSTEYIKQITEKLGMLIKNARLSTQIIQEIKTNQYGEAQMKTFFELTPDYIAMVDGSIFESKNLSKSWTKSLHQRMKTFAVGDSQVVHKAMKKAEETRGIVFAESQYQDEVFKVRTVLWQVSYLDAQQYYIIWGQDITLRKELEEQQLQLEEAVEKERINRKLLKNMSYGFEKPIEQITQNVKKLEVLEIGCDGENYIKMAKDNTFRLKRLVTNLLDSSEGQSGEFRICRETCDLVRSVKEIIEGMSYYFKDEERQVSLVTEVPVLIYSIDLEKLENILINLISNGIKYTKPEDKIVIYIEEDADEIIIHVMDNGEGIVPKRLPDIFSRFNQEEVEGMRKREGSGIGLSTTKCLVELHGGTIEAKSNWGVGSEFIMKFPKDIHKTLEYGSDMAKVTLSEVYRKVYGGNEDV